MEEKKKEKISTIKKRILLPEYIPLHAFQISKIFLCN